MCTGDLRPAGAAGTPHIHRAEVAAQALKIIDADGVEALVRDERVTMNIGAPVLDLLVHQPGFASLDIRPLLRQRWPQAPADAHVLK